MLCLMINMIWQYNTLYTNNTLENEEIANSHALGYVCMKRALNLKVDV